MLMSLSKGFIFFHVAKVAGLSIRDALKGYCIEPEHFKIARPPQRCADGSPNPFYEAWANTLLHARARDVRREVSAEVFDGCFKFAFVRNPWDWQVSMYHFILKRTDHVHHERVRAMAGFDAYLDWVVTTPRPFPRGVCKLQSDVVTDDNGGIMVDFVGRYESLTRDFQQVCRTLGVTASLPRLNRTDHRAYPDYYSDYGRALVAEHFRADVERFGYRFEADR
jgi:hypothetical protein